MTTGVRSFILALLFVPMILLSASAVFLEERLDDPEQEERAREISEGIRCLVCQNQSILDSNADLAKDLRQIVRERVALGESNDKVREFLVTRYGDWVLLDPPFKLRTVFLWLGPVLIFIIGAIAAIVFLRGRNRQPDAEEPGELTPAEEARLKNLLDSESDISGHKS
ncbi:cytochrome c-type biogenesis protein [uncultured Sneathiella sp.]|uniref:cytochrome c-type biogenesis protein n=1 Tax=uncultured Sneathiella sp. TaxID=879315 RepID=UPI0030EB792D